MLKQLNIKNLILIEFLEVSFSSGFNVITGETGAGKSAIISAIKLICGERSDTKLIRKGADKAIVEALFSIEEYPNFTQLLQESGIECDHKEDIIIRREIYSSGKSRAFINHQMAQITLLKKIGEKLIHIVGQHANQRLFSLDEHRNVLDIFGCHQLLLSEYRSCWQELSQFKHRLHGLIEGEAPRIREIERLEVELEEISGAKLKEGEEEDLFSEFTLLTQKDEILRKAQFLADFFEKGGNSLTAQLSKKIDVFTSLVAIDPTLKDSLDSFRSAAIELQEVSHSLNYYISRFENDPSRIEFLNERLTLINKLKRKYGSTINHIFSYAQEAKERLTYLENSEKEIETVSKLVHHLESEIQKISFKLTEARKNTAINFEQQVIGELKDLNLPHIQFKVVFHEQERSIHGNEKIEFFFSPNLGENIISVRESASGGEISRIVLAIETILSSKNEIKTIIFDEIDSNIGGETASVIGKKIKVIAQTNQVMCITHFSQVAEQAENHFMIEKREQEGRTFSFLEILDRNKREKELYRMIGKK